MYTYVVYILVGVNRAFCILKNCTGPFTWSHAVCRVDTYKAKDTGACINFGGGVSIILRMV